MIRGFLKYMDPQGQGGAEGGGSPQPIIYEHEGQKYNITELLGVKTEYDKYKDDLPELGNLKQDREALRTLEAGINRDPELVKRVRENVGLHIAGMPVNPSQPITPPATPAQPAAPASGAEKSKTPWTPEQMAEMQALRGTVERINSQVGSVVTVEGQRAFEADRTNFITKHPEFKDKMNEVYAAGKELIQERASNLIRLGVQPNDAYAKAQNDVSALSHEELMYQSPTLRKVYEDSLIKRVSGRQSLPAGVGTPAEELQAGQPGITPEADAELLKSLQAAGGNKEKREAALIQWSNRTGRDPLELYGFEPKDARGLSVPKR